MPETKHTQEDVSYIRTHVDRIEQMTKFAISSSPESKAFVKKYLEERDGAAKTYLAIVGGPKSQDELIKITGRSQATVSKVCKHLSEQGLIAKVPDPAKPNSFKYACTELERLLRISKIAKQVNGK